MSEINKKAVSEVIDILKHSEIEVTQKIPKKFIEFLMNNSDHDYIPNINYSEENWENGIEEDAKALIALIYRDYIMGEEEKKEVVKEAQKQEQEMREKYNPDNIFKKNSKIENEKLQDSIEQDVPKTLLIIKEEKWYERIINKIKEIFGIRHK